MNSGDEISLQPVGQRSLLPDPGIENGAGRSWLGGAVREYRGPVSELRRHIPHFERRPFQLAGRGANPHLDMIVRMPTAGDESPVPVGVVSKGYGLLQHTAVCDAARKALSAVSRRPEKLIGKLTITEFGERMSLSLWLPEEFAFDPGDGKPMGLQLVCFNSVDRSLKFSALVGWLRFVCENGLVIVERERDVIRLLHNRTLDVSQVGEILRQGIAAARHDQQRIGRWRERAVSQDTLRRWVDSPLRKRWGAKAATRTYHIATSGHDVEFASPFQKARPSQRAVKVANSVPGVSAPATDAFAVSQALSWLASNRANELERFERMAEIPSLIDQLRP